MRWWLPLNGRQVLIGLPVTFLPWLATAGIPDPATVIEGGIDRTLAFLTTVAAIVVVMLFGLPDRCKFRHKDKEKEDVEQSCVEHNAPVLNDDSALSCWAQGFGRFKHCGLRLDPYDTSVPPPCFDLAPKNLALPPLSETEMKALEELERRVKKYTHKHRTDQCTLVRFLRARKFSVDRAERYFLKAVKYYDKHGVTEAMETWNLEAYERCLGPWWLSGGFFGHGLKGEPIAYERLARCNWLKIIKALDWRDIERLDIVHCLRAVGALEEDCQRTGQPLGNGILVQDCDGFGWDQVSWNGSLAYNKLLECRNFLIPECLTLILVVRAPSSWCYAWNGFKHILDPGIRAKVRVARPGSETISLLRTYISDSQIPGFLGGSNHIEGDPQCRKVLAPGGVIPKAAVDRFHELKASDEAHDKFCDDDLSLKSRGRTESEISIGSAGSADVATESSARRSGSSWMQCCCTSSRHDSSVR